jgi:hypothetical protein
MIFVNTLLRMALEKMNRVHWGDKSEVVKTNCEKLLKGKKINNEHLL